MGMGLAGLYGAAGANAGLEQLLSRRLEEQKFAELQRQAQQREQLAQQSQNLEGQQMMERALSEQQQRDYQRKAAEALAAERTAREAEIARKGQEAEAQSAFMRDRLNDPKLDPEMRKALEYQSATGMQAPANLFRDQMAETQARIAAQAERANAPKPLDGRRVTAILSRARAQSARANGGVPDPGEVYDIAYHDLEIEGADDPNDYIGHLRPTDSPAGGQGGAPSAPAAGAPAAPAPAANVPPPGSLIPNDKIAAIVQQTGKSDMEVRAALAARGYKVPPPGSTRIVTQRR